MKDKLEKQIIDEKTGIKYVLVGDYYYPLVTIPKQKKIHLNKYGRMRLNYLKENKKAEYEIMLLDNTLISHLDEVQTACENRVNMLIKEMEKKEKVTEELKAKDQLKWVGMMNNIKNSAEEIVEKELIFI